MFIFRKFIVNILLFSLTVVFPWQFSLDEYFKTCRCSETGSSSAGGFISVVPSVKVVVQTELQFLSASGFGCWCKAVCSPGLSASSGLMWLNAGTFQLWGHPIQVDWAEPEKDMEEEAMQRVRVLYVSPSCWTAGSEEGLMLVVRVQLLITETQTWRRSRRFTDV